MKNSIYTFKLIDLDTPVSSYFNRVFPMALVKQLIESPTIQEKLKAKCFFCMLCSRDELSSDNYDEYAVNFKDVCAGVEKLYIEDSQLKIDIEVLDTPMGKVLKELLDANKNTVKCLPIFAGNYTGHDPETITDLELHNIYFIVD